MPTVMMTRVVTGDGGCYQGDNVCVCVCQVMARFLRGKKKNSGCGDSSSNSARPFLRKGNCPLLTGPDQFLQ